MERLIKVCLSGLPWLIIAGLLWAGIFIKPTASGTPVEPPVIERADAFFGVAAPAPAQLWLAGNNGKIIHSADGGASWKSQKLSGRMHLQDVAAWDADRLLAVGNDGMVFVTEDGGKQWRGQKIDFLHGALNKLLRVKTYADGKAWAVGEMGALIHSADYGQTWERRRPEQDTALNDVYMIDGEAGWVVGEAGGMLRTADGGASWETLAPVVRGSLMAVAFRDAENGVVVGLEGVILVTRDGGRHWQSLVATRQGDGTPLKLHLYDVAWDAGSERWFAVGDQGLYVTATADAAAWEGGRLEAKEGGWHTRIVPAHGRFYLAGATVGEWSGLAGSWRRFGAGN